MSKRSEKCQQLQCDRSGESDVETAIHHLEPCENRIIRAARIERICPLRNDERQKRGSLRILMSVIVFKVQINAERERCHGRCDDDHALDEHPTKNRRIGIFRLAFHGVLFARLKPERDDHRRVGDEIYPQDLYWLERHLDSRCQRTDHRDELASVCRQQIKQHSADIGNNNSPFSHGVDDGFEIVIQQDNPASVLGDL